MKKYKITEHDNYVLVENEGGATLSYAKDSGVTLIEDDGYAFKDLNRNGTLDPYEDWRLPARERIADLVKQLSVEDMAGLMIYSQHLSVSSSDSLFSSMFAGTYDGKPLKESDCEIWNLSDQQKEYLREHHIRHLLLTTVDDARTSAKWNNQIQAFCEQLPFGIPANISSDPRHTAEAKTEFDAGAGGDISKWPQPLGLAATFDPDLVKRFGEVAAREYRSLGIATALSPQIDLATDPRWMRFNGTFGEDTALSTDMARAYCDGFQSDEQGGWGKTSVNAMVKHWPGGGSGESGRDAHFGYGKYAVYPGNNFAEHMKPFTEGAFALDGGTEKASAVMPYYTISYEQDKVNGENVGNSYSKYIIQDLLRDTYKYDGVVCTDWSVTHDNNAIDQFMSGKCWGMEEASEAERHYKIIMAGCDQFGGNHDINPVLAAYEIGSREHGEEYMRKRFEQSAARLLRNSFQCGLFDDPYIDPDQAQEVVGNPDFMKEGYEAQLRSIIMLKNHDQVLPIKPGKKVYVPKRRVAESRDWFGNVIPAHEEEAIEKSLLGKYYTVCERPEDADFALVFIESPQSVGYDETAGYKPVTLQYRSYTAQKARVESIASDARDPIINRTYNGKSNLPSNSADLDIILETAADMAGKPVIVSINTSNPTVVREFEGAASAILLDFQVQKQAILDIISGKAEPSGLLPFQMPADMETVETQYEDVAHDMKCHQDADGNCYDFAFGMNFNGVIEDNRVRKYRK